MKWPLTLAFISYTVCVFLSSLLSENCQFSESSENTQNMLVLKGLTGQSLSTYSRVRNKHTGTFIRFWEFFKKARSYSIGYVY